jgi:hypothetical protein
LSEHFIINATTSDLVWVILEEYGHHVDTQVNTADSSWNEVTPGTVVTLRDGWISKDQFTPMIKGIQGVELTHPVSGSLIDYRKCGE